MGEAIGLTIKFVNLSYHGKYDREEERVDFSGGQATFLTYIINKGRREAQGRPPPQPKDTTVMQSPKTM